MRFLKSLILSGLIGAISLASNAEAQVSSINGPSLGFAPDSTGSVISPIIGVAGASLLADGLTLDRSVRDAVISPKQNYALAVRSDDGQLVVIDLASPTPQTSAIDGAHAGPDLITVSPTGSSAATFDANSNTVQVIHGLPQAAQIIHEFDASHISGHALSLSISDDGTVAMIKFVDADGASLWVLNSAGAVSRLAVDQPVAAAFFANRNDAIVSDGATQSAVIVMDAGRTATQVPLVSNMDGMNGFSSISASDDGGRVFLADANSGNVAIVDVQTRRAVVVPCGCKPAGLYRLNGNSIFGLNNVSADPIMVLDASGVEPRIVVVPPRGNGTGTQEPQDKHKEHKTL